MPEEIQGVTEGEETPATPTVEKPEASSAPDVKQDVEPKDVPYSEFKKRLEEQGSSKDAKYGKLVEKLGGYGIDVDEQGDVFSNYNQPATQTPQTSQPSEVDKMWENTDPETRKAMERTMTSGFEWYDNVNRQLSSEKNILRRDPVGGKQFAELESEVDNYLNKVPIQDRAKKGIVKIAFNMVRGSHIDEYTKRAAEEAVKTNQNKESLQTPGGSAQMPSQSPTITAEERVVAEKMGLTPEDYTKYKGKRTIG